MAVYAPEYRLTVYQEDDVTPMGDPWTSVPGGSRPYLDAASVEWREDRIDLLRGEARIGEVAVRILDKRTGTDQADRVLTALLGDTEGNPRWNGLRAVLEWREGPSASWRVLKDGRIGSLTLERDLVTYRIHILDDRIGMLARAFTSGEGKFAYDYMRRWDAGLAPSYAAPGSLWPAGPLVPYIDATGVQGKPGTFRVLGSGPAPYAIDVGQVALSIPRNKALDTLTRATRRIGPYSVFRDLMVRIRRDSDGTVGYYFVLEQQPIALGGTREPERLLLVRDGAEPIFSDGDVVRFWVMPYGEPSEYAPFHWRAHPARFVADLLAGHFGPYRQGAPARAIRHDAARLAALEADGYWPIMRDKILAPVRIYDYLREAIFGAIGWADGIDDQGRVYILTHRPPTSLAGLPVLDGSKVAPPEDAPWRNPGTEAIAQVVFEGRLERKVEPSEDAPPDLIEEAESRFVALSADTYGRLSEREVRLPARALRSLNAQSIDVTRWVDTYSAFLRRQQARGPQIVAADVPWRYADQLGLRVGGHVIGQIPWIPDPVTNRRGGTRVYQVQGVQQRGGLVRLTLLDLGGNAFAQQPTATATAKNSQAPYDAVDVTLSVPSGVIADVWTAETSTSVSTRPAESSPLWRPKVQSGLGQNGVYTARDHAAGSRVWIRYRGIPSGQDRLPSGWRYPTNDGRPVDYVDLDARPEFVDVQVAPGDGPGEVDVAVRTNSAGKGVRIEYGPTPSLGSTADLNTTSGSAQTTLTLPPGSLAHLRLTAYPQFPVGGVAGETREATVQVPAAPAALSLRARVIAQSPSTLTARVAVADPVDPTRTGDATITYTQSGTGGVTPASPQVVQAAKIRDTLDASEAAGGYVDFTVTRPAPGAGVGQVAFAAQRLGRVPAVAAVEVPERSPDPVNDGPPEATITVEVNDPNFVTVRLNARRGVPPYQYRRVVGAGDGDLSSVSYTTLPSGGVTLQVKRQPDRPVFVYVQVRDSRGVESEVADYAVAPLGRGAGNIIRPTRTALPSDEVQRPTSSATTWKILDTSLADAGLAIGDTVSAGGKFRGAAASATVRFRLQFLNASGAVISTHDGPAVTPGNGQVLESKVEDVVIPSGTATIRTMAVAVSGSGQPTAFEWMVNPGPVLLPYRHPAYQAGRDRLSDIVGHLGPGVGQDDGIAVRPLARGRLTGLAKHGQQIDFNPPFQNAPLVIIRGGIAHEPRAKWGPIGDGTESGAFDPNRAVYEDVVAENLSAGGFKVRARLRQKGTLTPASTNFSSGNLLTNVGNFALSGSISPSIDGQYTIHYSVSLELTSQAGRSGSLQVVVAVDVATPTFVEVAAVPYSISGTGTVSNNWPHEQVTIPGIGAAAIRLRIKSIQGINTTFTSVSVHGFDGAGDPSPGVTYFTGTGEQYASKTPDPDDYVMWEAIEVS